MNGGGDGGRHNPCYGDARHIDQNSLVVAVHLSRPGQVDGLCDGRDWAIGSDGHDSKVDVCYRLKFCRLIFPSIWTAFVGHRGPSPLFVPFRDDSHRASFPTLFGRVRAVLDGVDASPSFAFRGPSRAQTGSSAAIGAVLEEAGS